MSIEIPFGKTHLQLEVPKDRIAAVLRPNHGVATGDETQIVAHALENPIGSAPLTDLAREARNAVIITSDHTRPVPSRLTMPLLLAALRRGNPAIEISILVATGCHRATTQDELKERFGNDICQRELIHVHDCDDPDTLVELGKLPSGGELIANRKATDTDLLLAEGFIEPHFFAGFSGGPKAILPGIVSRATVLANHCSAFIASPMCRTGILDGNPIQTDMVWAAREAKLQFVLNVTLDEDKRVVAAFCGDPIAAHRCGCTWVASRSIVQAVFSPICITSNGGWPLDQNIYQAVKGLTAAEASTREGGVIIMASEGVDGIGGERFLEFFAESKSPQQVLERIEQIPADKTEPDQWQAQILARILCHRNVVMLSHEKNRFAIGRMFMTYASSLDEAMRTAERIAGAKSAVTVIPDGVSVIVH